MEKRGQDKVGMCRKSMWARVGKGVVGTHTCSHGEYCYYSCSLSPNLALFPAIGPG